MYVINYNILINNLFLTYDVCRPYEVIVKTSLCGSFSSLKLNAYKRQGVDARKPDWLMLCVLFVCNGPVPFQVIHLYLRHK